jgi:hypothetical protein
LDVRIAGDNADGIGTIVERVGEEFDGDVDVSFLFFLKDVALEASGPALDFPGLESAEDDLNTGQGAERFEVAFLALAGGGVFGGGNNQGRENFDRYDLLVRPEGTEEGADIQPLPFRVRLENRVVPVIPVDIDDEPWFHWRILFKE